MKKLIGLVLVGVMLIGLSSAVFALNKPKTVVGFLNTDKMYSVRYTPTPRARPSGDAIPIPQRAHPSGKAIPKRVCVPVTYSDIKVNVKFPGLRKNRLPPYGEVDVKLEKRSNGDVISRNGQTSFPITFENCQNACEYEVSATALVIVPPSPFPVSMGSSKTIPDLRSDSDGDITLYF